ncbi:MAG: ion transporter [Lachnospiraceae bacterium]|nr:ion transporter [Lachnospiraceae bacterium]
MRKRIFDIIQIGNKKDPASRAFDIGITVVILLNIIVTFLETFEELSDLKTLFTVIEGITVAVFCVEYILRLVTADYLYPEDGKVKSRLHFMISFDGVVDLLTILPFMFLSGFIAFRILRIVRIFHLFRINTHYDSFNVIRLVIHERWKQIGSSLVIIFIIMLAASLGMYSVEHATNEGFENAFSGMWWSVSALLTVGYGDIYPITVMGKIMGIITAFAGVGLVAIPTGIISAGFVEQYRLNSEADRIHTDVEKIGEIVLSPGHVFIGKKVAEIKEKYDCSLYMVIRNELMLLPTDTLVLKENDIAVIKSEKLVKTEKN